ncbi:MAG TPA: hypothetical protein VNZ53_22180 [Steroidobacteraceae bacterium]|jgi:hypothetical protein|nr:hypothetical protein [Steroidobacteraceae bacterium]
MKVQCYGCGQDCSNAYGTHNGYPYHFGCLPIPSKKKKTGNPYGEWCRDPAACAGKGYCPLDPTCGD